MAVAGDGDVLPLYQILHLAAQAVHVVEVLHADALLAVLVGVHRGDAAAGGTELLIGQALLLHHVLQAVIGQADDGLLADLEVFRGDGDALLGQAADLTHQVLQVDDHAVAHDVDGGLPEDAGGQQVQDEGALVIDDGVACIIAALIATDNVIIGGKQVHHTALAFISPVDSNDCGQHLIFPFCC